MLFFGGSAGNDVRVVDWDVHAAGTLARFQVRGQGVEIEMGLLGEGAALNAAGALAVALGLGEPLEAAARGIAGVEPSPGRMQPRRARGDRLVVDDTYNANPTSVEVALGTARQIADERDAPLVVVLGDMKELGAQSEAAHRKVGEQVADIDAFLFVGCGEGMHVAVDAANARGIDTLWFQDAEECREIGDRLPLNAVVLVKGSRSTQMERVVTPLLEEERR